MAQRTQYANAILPTYRPTDASVVVKSRLASAEHLNGEVADWFRERARIEETYASELDKLTRKGIPELQRSGLFEATWTSLLRSTHESANASNSFAHKIHQDVEQPLRRYTSQSSQWQDMRVLQNELDTLSHTFNDAERKKKHTDEVRAQWEAQAPYILEQVETIDTSRLGLLKNLLTTFGTIEADKSEKSLKVSEGLLNNVLSYEPTDDIAAFAAVVGKGDAVHHAPPLSIRSRHDHASVSESLGPASSNRSDSLHELPHHDSSPSKLRNKVGSIFRSSKKKNKNAPAPAPAPAQAAAPASAPIPASRYRNGSSSNRQSVVAESDNSSTAPSQFRKPPPPPARKANGQRNSFEGSPVTLSAPPRVNEDFEDREMEVPATVQEEEEESTQRPFKIDIKEDSINEKRDDDDVALSVIASTLRQRNTISGRGNRGRRDIQSTLFTNIPPSGVEPQSPPAAIPESSQAPVLPPINPSTPIAPVEHHEAISSPATDIQSVFSEQSTAPPVSAVAGANLIHPQLPTEAGLNASIVEVINAVITDGSVTRAQLVGEIAFNYHGTEPLINLRVGNLGIFSSLTPNQVFIKAINDSTYALNTRVLGGAAAAGFSFASQNAQAFVPVDFSPIWRIENNQSSLMLAYKVANSFLTESPVVLHDLVISVPVEGGVATSAVSKPHAVFNKVKQRIVWKFPEPVVVKAGFEERLLCRFATSGPAKESAKGIEIKFRTITAGVKKLPVEVSGDESAGHQVVLDYSIAEDSEAWKPVNAVVSVSTGQFSVHSEANVQSNF